MQITSKITPAVVQAATAMLSPYIPEISPTSLITALKEYNVTEPKTKIQRKPYTRFEVAELLGLSLMTINRMMDDGRLRRIKVGLRAVRIDPASVEAILEGGTAKLEPEV